MCRRVAWSELAAKMYSQEREIDGRCTALQAVLDGELAVPCNLQSAIAGSNSARRFTRRDLGLSK